MAKSSAKKKPEPVNAYVPTKIHCDRDAKNRLIKLARHTVKTTCTDRVVFCHEGRLFIKATCDTRGQAGAYADRLKPLIRVLESL